MERETIKRIIENHPDKKEIFELVRLLDKSCVPYWFNYDKDIAPTPFNHDGESPESINWETYRFRIMIDCKDKQTLSVMFSGNNNELLEVCNLITADLETNLTAAQVAELVKAHF